ncbi:RxLR effector protein [Phytophthora megakarya]|uniref:RxLR effector protein n=1 Tax=Phytophthora megakarya TaxID=4795 RepID=A0A225VHA0_9STRA|nr:RxLR effector protein [Phytophthora megakarya]
MRLIYAVTFMIAATLPASSAAVPVASNSKGVVQSAEEASPDAIAIYKNNGRLLRRVDKQNMDDNDDGDDEEEERALGDLAKKIAEAPSNAVKKIAHTQKIKKALRDAGNYEKFLEKARESITK